MSTGQELEQHSQILLDGIGRGVGGAALDQLVENVTNALSKSFFRGDKVRIAGSEQRLTTRLQVLNALNQGYMIEVDSANSTSETC